MGHTLASEITLTSLVFAWLFRHIDLTFEAYEASFEAYDDRRRIEVLRSQ